MNGTRSTPTPPTHRKGAVPGGSRMTGHLAAMGGKVSDSTPGGGHVGSPALDLKPTLRRGSAPGSALSRGK